MLDYVSHSRLCFCFTGLLKSSDGLFQRGGRPTFEIGQFLEPIDASVLNLSAGQESEVSSCQ